MNILMLSLDSSILDKNSISASRMKDYGSICDELHVVVLGGSGTKLSISDNIFIYPTNKKRIISLLIAFFKAKKILKKGKDWIITCQDPFEAGFIGWLLARKHKIGFEVQLHGDFYSNPYWRKERLLNQFRWFLGKFVLRRASTARVVSERIEKSIEKINKQIIVIPIFTEKKEVVKSYKESNEIIILSIGNLVPVKNHKQLIDVFSEIKNDLPEAKLIIVGDGPLRENFKFQISNFKLEDCVELVGHQENLDTYYSEADIFVHPSLYEGWGRVLIEAVYYQLPIVMTDVGLSGEVIKNEESGLVVPVDDKEALKQAILRLVKDKELQKKLAQNAKKSIEGIECSKQEYLEKIKQSWIIASKN